MEPESEQKPDFRARRAQQGHQALRELPAQQERPGHREPQELLAHRVPAYQAYRPVHLVRLLVV